MKPAAAKVPPTLTTTSIGAKRKEQPVKLGEVSPVKKQQKINWVLASPVMQTQQQKVQAQATTLTTANTMVANAVPKTQTISLQDLKFYSANNKLIPITLKDGSNNDQQVMAQIDSKNLVLPGFQFQLTSAGNLPTSLSLTPNQQPQFVQSQIQLPQQIQQIQQTSNVQTATLQQAQILPETRTMYRTSTGQNVTVTHHPMQQINNTTTTDQTLHTSTVETSAGKVQLTTLQNVATPNITHPLPQSSAITFQRVKVEQPDNSIKSATTSPTTKKVTAQQTFKLATISNAGAGAKMTTAKKPPINRIVVTTAKAPVTRTTAANTTARTITTTTTTSGDAPKNEVPTCEICDKVFKRKEHLAQHLKLHLGLRPFKCEELNCNKTFSRKEHLMRHCVSHTGRKQFDCEFCHKLFSRKDNLNKHKRYIYIVKTFWILKFTFFYFFFPNFRIQTDLISKCNNRTQWFILWLK